MPTADPAGASRMQSLRLVRRVAEVGSLSTFECDGFQVSKLQDEALLSRSSDLPRLWHLASTRATFA